MKDFLIQVYSNNSFLAFSLLSVSVVLFVKFLFCRRPKWPETLTICQNLLTTIQQPASATKRQKTLGENRMHGDSDFVDVSMCAICDGGFTKIISISFWHGRKDVHDHL